MEDFVAHSFWGNKEVEWYAKKNIDRSRGMITLWKLGLLEFLFNFEDEGFAKIHL